MERITETIWTCFTEQSLTIGMGVDSMTTNLDISCNFSKYRFLIHLIPHGTTIVGSSYLAKKDQMQPPDSKNNILKKLQDLSKFIVVESPPIPMVRDCSVKHVQIVSVIPSVIFSVILRDFYKKVT